MTIRRLTHADRARAFELWNESCARGEVAYKPLTPELFGALFDDNSDYDGEFDFVAEDGGEIIGWAGGARKKRFLPGETHANTPGYLTNLFVDARRRRQGVGTALINALEAAFKHTGKTSVVSSGNNPVNLGWLIPGTPGHDHNNAPGTDVECPGYGFLLARGYSDIHREAAMYLKLSDYAPDGKVEQIRTRLAQEGVYAGRYDTAWECEFDGMCDRVGSEYWRKVLYDETRSARPRVILAGVSGKHIVGFTGPVDVEPSGRGWFSGICVDPEYGQRGIATVLFNDLMREFIDAGARFSTLFTGVDNHAQRLYARTGFKTVKTFAIMKKSL